MAKDLASSRWLRKTTDGTCSMQLRNGMTENDHQSSDYSHSMHNVTGFLRLEVYCPQTGMRQEVFHHPNSNVCPKTVSGIIAWQSAGRLGMGQNWVPSHGMFNISNDQHPFQDQNCLVPSPNQQGCSTSCRYSQRRQHGTWSQEAPTTKKIHHATSKSRINHIKSYHLLIS